MGKLTIEDIANLLSVSRSFIKSQLRNQDLEWELVQEGKRNTKIYVCSEDKLLQYIANNSETYHYDTNLKNFYYKKRPELSRITFPEELREQILAGNFVFLTVEDLMTRWELSSRESIYQHMYKYGYIILKFKGKTYFWLGM